jgi:hypothetical protein
MPITTTSPVSTALEIIGQEYWLGAKERGRYGRTHSDLRCYVSQYLLVEGIVSKRRDFPYRSGAKRLHPACMLENDPAIDADSLEARLASLEPE